MTIEKAMRTYRLPNPTTPEDLESCWSKILTFGDRILLAGHYYNGAGQPSYFGAVYEHLDDDLSCEGTHDDRIELASFNLDDSTKNLAEVLWDNSITITESTITGSCNQYFLNANNQWEQFGTYNIPSDNASSISASNLDVYDASGNHIRSALSDMAVGKLNNPTVIQDSSMQASKRVTWDCVWFGNYPQSEVASGSELYNSLAALDDSGWNNMGDIWFCGFKYRRVKKNTDYRYFRYDPIKWRVLQVNNDRVLMMSDLALEVQKYNLSRSGVTWETTTVRSYLNGYGSSANSYGKDYSKIGFIDNAFNDTERSEIIKSEVINDKNLTYNVSGGATTEDKLFLLSENKTYGNKSETYGFVADHNKYDEAKRCLGSDYSKALGLARDSNYNGACWWWLRSPGNMDSDAVLIFNTGGWSGYFGYVEM